jgi:hypothetical protein
METLIWIVFVGRIVTALGAASFLGRLAHAHVKKRYNIYPLPSSKWLVAFHVSISATALFASLAAAAISATPTIASLALLGYPVSFYFANMYLNKRVQEVVD